MEHGIESRIMMFLRKNPRGACISDIARAMGVNRITAKIALAGLHGAQKVDFQKVGPTKLYYLKQSKVILGGKQ